MIKVNTANYIKSEISGIKFYRIVFIVILCADPTQVNEATYFCSSNYNNWLSINCVKLKLLAVPIKLSPKVEVSIEPLTIAFT